MVATTNEWKKWWWTFRPCLRDLGPNDPYSGFLYRDVEICFPFPLFDRRTFYFRKVSGLNRLILSLCYLGDYGASVTLEWGSRKSWQVYNPSRTESWSTWSFRTFGRRPFVSPCVVDLGTPYKGCSLRDLLVFDSTFPVHLSLELPTGSGTRYTVPDRTVLP